MRFFVLFFIFCISHTTYSKTDEEILAEKERKDAIMESIKKDVDLILKQALTKSAIVPYITPHIQNHTVDEELALDVKYKSIYTAIQGDNTFYVRIDHLKLVPLSSKLNIKRPDFYVGSFSFDVRVVPDPYRYEFYNFMALPSQFKENIPIPYNVEIVWDPEKKSPFSIRAEFEKIKIPFSDNDYVRIEYALFQLQRSLLSNNLKNDIENEVSLSGVTINRKKEKNFTGPFNVLIRTPLLTPTHEILGYFIEKSNKKQSFNTKKSPNLQGLDVIVDGHLYETVYKSRIDRLKKLKSVKSDRNNIKKLSFSILNNTPENGKNLIQFAISTGDIQYNDMDIKNFTVSGTLKDISPDIFDLYFEYPNQEKAQTMMGYYAATADVLNMASDEITWQENGISHNLQSPNLRIYPLGVSSDRVELSVDARVIEYLMQKIDTPEQKTQLKFRNNFHLKFDKKPFTEFINDYKPGTQISSDFSLEQIFKPLSVIFLSTQIEIGPFYSQIQGGITDRKGEIFIASQQINNLLNTVGPLWANLTGKPNTHFFKSISNLYQIGITTPLEEKTFSIFFNDQGELMVNKTPLKNVDVLQRLFFWLKYF